MADTSDLKSLDENHLGSNPSAPTIYKDNDPCPCGCGWTCKEHREYVKSPYFLGWDEPEY